MNSKPNIFGKRLGKLLQEIRSETKLALKEVVYGVGISWRTLQNAEAGIVSPKTLKMIFKEYKAKNIGKKDEKEWEKRWLKLKIFWTESHFNESISQPSSEASSLPSSLKDEILEAHEQHAKKLLDLIDVYAKHHCLQYMVPLFGDNRFIKAVPHLSRMLQIEPIIPHQSPVREKQVMPEIPDKKLSQDKPELGLETDLT